MTVSTAITGLQIITTAAIILIPVLTNHPVNPLQRRADKALKRLRSRDDNINELSDFSQAVEDPQTEEDLAFKTIFELADDDIDELDEIDQAFESGYLQRGDPGFRILLDAISNNRSIDKSEVTAIGMLFGDVAILNKMDTNEDMPEGSRVPIGPNAALFVDYEGGAIPDRELITYYPESPSLTLSLHELELWLKEEIRRKSHYIVIVLTLIWTTSSLLSTIV
ncbi:hypothetical protein EXE51_17285 [Halorubrum sp. CGM5_25_10-8B]|uniref:hypothetical protein n=1 Tax=Halorubrum sp. CGM5_25_10-8B TaxID=2518115 RepID=UPI0010F64AC9|nr:hypothetical protein [Halorubrum sp. CGM5_25_10-8B]TKX34882.1 hypothetical protein EXE51_17285 [Halorubrum sp. CGM5_25_10-8B]